MAYDFDKKDWLCDICHVTEKELKENPQYTGKAYPYEYSKSFMLGFNGSILCYKCHKENLLSILLDMMDKIEK